MLEDQYGGVVLIGGSSFSIINFDTLLPHGGIEKICNKCYLF